MEILKPSEGETKRRSELISQSKTQNLSRDEVRELQAILTKEARYSYTSGEIGFLAFVCIASIINSLPLLTGV
ncbi:hypothetical protein ES708_25386 [subsurface metagenome]